MLSLIFQSYFLHRGHAVKGGTIVTEQGVVQSVQSLCFVEPFVPTGFPQGTQLQFVFLDTISMKRSHM